MITIKDSDGNVLKEIEVDIGKNLLAQITEAGIDIPAACYTGICGACMCDIEEGKDNIIKNFAGEEGFPLDDTEVMTCIAGLKNAEQNVTLKTMY